MSRATADSMFPPPKTDWAEVEAELELKGWAVVPGVLDVRACADLSELDRAPEHFRKHVVMQEHAYGQGEYRYLRYPLPRLVQELRQEMYPPLSRVANHWAEQLGEQARYPDTLDAFLARCHAAGQTEPTPLLLRYGRGDYNHLHRDLYGAHVFPLQAAILLSEPGHDFEGGELVLVESRPRMQSRAIVVPLHQGDAVIFAVHHRPEPSKRGHRRVDLRHGVSTIRSGRRQTLGIIFHDAEH